MSDIFSRWILFCKIQYIFSILILKDIINRSHILYVFFSLQKTKREISFTSKSISSSKSFEASLFLTDWAHNGHRSFAAQIHKTRPPKAQPSFHPTRSGPNSHVRACARIKRRSTANEQLLIVQVPIFVDPEISRGSRANGNPPVTRVLQSLQKEYRSFASVRAY